MPAILSHPQCVPAGPNLFNWYFIIHPFKRSHILTPNFMRINLIKHQSNAKMLDWFLNVFNLTVLPICFTLCVPGFAKTSLLDFQLCMISMWCLWDMFSVQLFTRPHRTNLNKLTNIWRFGVDSVWCVRVPEHFPLWQSYIVLSSHRHDFACDVYGTYFPIITTVITSMATCDVC